MNPISGQALIGRINRKMYREDCVLRKTRSCDARSYVGDYYFLNWRTNFIVMPNVDLEALGREIGVLSQHECLGNAI
jgi:hypothetical protein